MSAPATDDEADVFADLRRCAVFELQLDSYRYDKHSRPQETNQLLRSPFQALLPSLVAPGLYLGTAEQLSLNASMHGTSQMALRSSF